MNHDDFDGAATLGKCRESGLGPENVAKLDFKWIGFPKKKNSATCALD